MKKLLSKIERLFTQGLRKPAIIIILIVSIFFVISDARAIEIETKRGDILLFGREACDSGLNCSPDKYLEQTYLAFFQQIGKVIGIYEPLLGLMETLDLTSFPFKDVNKKYYWHHVEIATSTNLSVSLMKDEIILILRLKQENPQFLLDIESMVEKFQDFKKTSGGYNQPFLGAIKKFTQWNINNGGWMNQPLLEKKWEDVYGVSLFLYKEPLAVQYSPVLGTLAHTDILDPTFWKRDLNCSTLTAWSFVWGWYKGAGKVSAYNLFFNNINNVDAIDALVPGQIGWFLTINNLVEVKEVWKLKSP